MIEVRLLRADDLAVLERVADDVFDGPIRPDRAAEFLADERHHLAVAVVDGVVAGFASAVHYVHPDKDPELWISEVGVAPSHRREGLATRLLDALRSHARALGCREVWVLTERENDGAMSFYRSTQGVSGPDDVVLFSWKVS